MKSFEEPLCKASDYYVEKERYLELLHHCRQYSSWLVKANEILLSFPKMCDVNLGNEWRDSVASKAAERERYLIKADTIKNLCQEVCPEAHRYLLICIVGGHSYDTIEAKFDTLPISRHRFYEAYRKFFWLLDKKLL